MNSNNSVSSRDMSNASSVKDEHEILEVGERRGSGQRKGFVQKVGGLVIGMTGGTDGETKEDVKQSNGEQNRGQSVSKSQQAATETDTNRNISSLKQVKGDDSECTRDKLCDSDDQTVSKDWRNGKDKAFTPTSDDLPNVNNSGMPAENIPVTTKYQASCDKLPESIAPHMPDAAVMRLENTSAVRDTPFSNKDISEQSNDAAIFRRLDNILSSCREINVVDDSKICDRLSKRSTDWRSYLSTQVRKCDTCGKCYRLQLKPPQYTSGHAALSEGGKVQTVSTAKSRGCDCGNQEDFSPWWDWTFPEMEETMADNVDMGPGDYKLDVIAQANIPASKTSSSTIKTAASQPVSSSLSSSGIICSSPPTSSCSSLGRSGQQETVPVVSLFNHSVNFWIMEID